jgi:hypothetical protein
MGAGSHAAPLAAAFCATAGPVLECGTGWWSTPLLHGMARATGRKLVSLESDGEWAGAMQRLYGSPNHSFYVMQDWTLAPPVYTKWGLAFIDFSPGDQRVDMIFRLKGQVDVFVAHDVEADIPPSPGAYGWARLNGVFKYELIFKDFRPWTAVWSDTIDVRRLFG